jgi:hypothetical protein
MYPCDAVTGPLDFRLHTDFDTYTDFGSVEPWALNDEPEILTRNCSKRSTDTCMYKSPSLSNITTNDYITDHSFSYSNSLVKSKPLPAIQSTSKSPLKIQYEEPLGFTELTPIYNTMQRLRKKLPMCKEEKFNISSYQERLESLNPVQNLYESSQESKRVLLRGKLRPQLRKQICYSSALSLIKTS